MPAVGNDIRQDDTDGSFQPSELDLPQVHFFLTPYSPLFFPLLTDLLLPSVFVLRVFSQDCIHLFPTSLSQDKLTRSRLINAIMSQLPFPSTSPFQENT